MKALNLNNKLVFVNHWEGHDRGCLPDLAEGLYNKKGLIHIHFYFLSMKKITHRLGI